jgi:hypothetical protein
LPSPQRIYEGNQVAGIRCAPTALPIPIDKCHHDNTCGILSVKLLRCCSSNWPRESSWETKPTPNNVHPSWSPSQDSQSMKTCYHLHHHHHYPTLLELAHNWSLCRWQPSP